MNLVKWCFKQLWGDEKQKSQFFLECIEKLFCNLYTNMKAFLEQQKKANIQVAHNKKFLNKSLTKINIQKCFRFEGSIWDDASNSFLALSIP